MTSPTSQPENGCTGAGGPRLMRCRGVVLGAHRCVACTVDFVISVGEVVADLFWHELFSFDCLAVVLDLVWVHVALGTEAVALGGRRCAARFMMAECDAARMTSARVAIPAMRSGSTLGAKPRNMRYNQNAAVDARLSSTIAVTQYAKGFKPGACSTIDGFPGSRSTASPDSGPPAGCAILVAQAATVPAARSSRAHTAAHIRSPIPRLDSSSPSAAGGRWVLIRLEFQVRTGAAEPSRDRVCERPISGEASRGIQEVGHVLRICDEACDPLLNEAMAAGARRARHRSGYGGDRSTQGVGLPGDVQ